MRKAEILATKSNKNLLPSLISDAAINLLPLDAQPVAQWGYDNDLSRFLVRLFDTDGEVLSADGSRRTVNYSSYGKTLYASQKLRIEEMAAIFEQCANRSTPVPASVAESVEPAQYLEDPDFGKAAKYFIVWNAIVDLLLSDSAFYSLAHLLESSSDLECSMELMGKLFYKQALQTLRSFVEDVVLPVHFSANPGGYARWKEESYHVPTMRGKNGMLTTLTSENVMLDNLSNEISQLYEALNGAVHGRESYLNHAGVYSGTYRGMIFTRDMMKLWANFLSRCVTCGIQLMKINLAQLEAFRLAGGLRCDVCHSLGSLEFVCEHEFGGEKSITYRCRICEEDVTL